MICEFRKFHSAVIVLFRTSGKLCCIAELASFEATWHLQFSWNLNH